MLLGLLIGILVLLFQVLIGFPQTVWNTWRKQRFHPTKLVTAELKDPRAERTARELLEHGYAPMGTWRNENDALAFEGKLHRVVATFLSPDTRTEAQVWLFESQVEVNGAAKVESSSECVLRSEESEGWTIETTSEEDEPTAALLSRHRSKLDAHDLDLRPLDGSGLVERVREENEELLDVERQGYVRPVEQGYRPTLKGAVLLHFRGTDRGTVFGFDYRNRRARLRLGILALAGVSIGALAALFAPLASLLAIFTALFVSLTVACAVQFPKHSSAWVHACLPTACLAPLIHWGVVPWIAGFLTMILVQGAMETFGEKGPHKVQQGTLTALRAGSFLRIERAPGEADCPYCRERIQAGDDQVQCPSCGVAQHAACLSEGDGACSTLGCARRARRRSAKKAALG